MFYLQRTYSSTRTAALSGEYRCSSCQFSSPVQIVGIGRGTGASPFLLDDAGAAARASHNAAASAESEAAMLADLLGCVRCPRCRRVDAAAFRRFWVRGAVMAGVGVAVFVGLGAALPGLAGGPEEAALWIGGLGAIASVGLVGWIMLGQWLGLRRQVVFLPPAEAPRPKAAPKKRSRRKGGAEAEASID